jgi:predicted secreted Zn-dependent protease
MSTAAIRRRLKQLEARRSASSPERPPTDAESITAFLREKYIQRYQPYDPPEPFDWAARLERTRQYLIDRGRDPDARY